VLLLSPLFLDQGVALSLFIRNESLIPLKNINDISNGYNSTKNFQPSNQNQILFALDSFAIFPAPGRIALFAARRALLCSHDILLPKTSLPTGCSCFECFPMGSNNTLTFQIPDRHWDIVFRQNVNMILAFPLHMCLTSPIFHIGPPCPLGPSSLGDRFSILLLKRQSLFNSHPGHPGWIIYF
jgi:hypothetical protein